MNLPVLSSEGNLAVYLQEIKKFPMLTAEEEYMLAKRYKEHGDSDAAHKLVTSHLRLVAKIAMGYRGYGLPVTDLISEGNVGIMQAVKRFDPEKGFRLATYAMWWIRAQIQEYVLHSWSLVKIGTTAAQKKLFFNLRKIKNQLTSIDSGNLSPENVREIATRLDVKEGEVIDMENRLFTSDQSLNVKLGEEHDTEWQDLIEDKQETHDKIIENNCECTIVPLNLCDENVIENLAKQIQVKDTSLDILVLSAGIINELSPVESIDLENFKDNQDFLKTRFKVSFDPGTPGEPVRVLFEKQDITHIVRTEEMAKITSNLAAEPLIREFIKPCQREFMTAPGLIADGRDMGTVIFHDAKHKIFLTASAKERAKRRQTQLKRQGLEVNMRTLLKELEERDKKDIEREHSPLAPADDSVIIDTTNLNPKGVVKKIKNYL